MLLTTVTARDSYDCSRPPSACRCRPADSRTPAVDLFWHLLRSHLKGRALHDAEDQGRPPVIVGGGLGQNGAHCWSVVILDAPAEGVGQQFLGHRPDELASAGKQHRLERHRPLKPYAVER